MYKFCLIFFFPFVIFAQSYEINSSEISLRLSDPLEGFNISTLFTDNNSPLSQRYSFQQIIQLFQQKRYSFTLKEIATFQRKYPNHIYTNEITWLKANTYLQKGEIPQANELLLTLIDSKNIEIQHRAFLDLYQLNIDARNNTLALNFIKKIHDSPIGSPYKEIAHMKYIYHTILSQNYKQASNLLQSFEQLYPNSLYINELQYFMALNDIVNNKIVKAKAYASTVLSNNTNIALQRLMGEIELQEKNYEQALSYFLPITKINNKFQDESIFKSALLYKYQKKYIESQKLFSTIVKYHQNSPYFERASTELANINIILKNYDDALIYYLQESGYIGSRKAIALLKIAEIYFLTTNTLATRRTADRIQSSFPYSAYANESLYWVGRSYLLDKEFKKSIQIFDDYLIREPQSPKKDEIMIFLGHAYANIDNQAKARGYFQEIINNSPNEYLKRQALIALGRSYNINEPKRSLEYFDRVWKVWPTAKESDQALYYSGANRYNLRLNTQALDIFKQLVANFPNSKFYQDAQLAIVKLEFKAENFNALLDINDIPLTVNNREIVSEFKELQARSFFRIGEFDQALSLFQESLKLTDNKNRKVELFLTEASTLRALNRHDEAVQKYEKYLNAIKNSGEINDLEEVLWAEIAFSYLEIQNTKKADKTIEYMIENFPQSKFIVDLYFKLADGYFSKKQYDQAAVYYNKTRMFAKNKSVISDALLREAWSSDYSGNSQTKEIFNLFLTTYPKHFGVPDIMSRLAILENTNNSSISTQLRIQLIQNYPDSLEAEQARLFFANQFDNNSSIDEFHQIISYTKDSRLKAKYLYKLGYKMIKENLIEEAIIVFKDIHALKDPVHGADALFEATKLLSDQKKYTEQLQLYINIITHYDELYYPRALDNIIQTYIVLEDYENAEKFKTRLLEQYADSKESKKWK